MNEGNGFEPFEEEESSSGAGWMTTYGDMMSLLMIFFILIMSFSSIEVEKFKAAMGSLQGAFGILGSSKEVKTDHSWFSPIQVNQKQESILEYVDNLNKVISQNDLEDFMDVYVTDGEVLIRIKDQVSFDLGEAELKPAFIPLLSRVSDTIVKFAGKIRVTGHTDDLPMHSTKYPSNWELSMDRALSVVRFFVKEKGINPVKLSAAGCSEYRPLVPNNSAENRAKNRRVEILLSF